MSSKTEAVLYIISLGMQWFFERGTALWPDFEELVRTNGSKKELCNFWLSGISDE